MRLLAIETSTENCSCAILKDDEIFYKSELAKQKHAEIILGMIDDLLKEAKIEKNELDGLVLGVGPGSFTGVRIATSTVQGLALALDLKVAKVSSLEALAFEAISNANTNVDYVISSIDARMGEVYINLFEHKDGGLKTLCDYKVLKPEDAIALINATIDTSSNVVLAGSGIEVLQEHGLNIQSQKLANFPQAHYILRKGELLFKQDDVVLAEDAQPLYVRNEVTWKKVNEQ